MTAASLLSFLKATCQILLLAVPIYYLLKFLRRSRGYRVLSGVLAIWLGAHLAARWLHLDEIGWVLERVAAGLPLFFVILFQPELRRIFAAIGRRGGDGRREPLRGEAATNVVTQIAKAVESLSGERIGAIIAIEREESLDPFAIGARFLHAPVNAELLNTIFYPGTPLHDGGVVVRGDTIVCAGCIFPLGAMDDRRRAYGTRHRAAIGLTERTDAIVVVVSEETGLVSVAYRGELLRGIGTNSLVKVLRSALAPGSDDAASRSLSEARGDDASPGASDRVAQAFAAVKEES